MGQVLTPSVSRRSAIAGLGASLLAQKLRAAVPSFDELFADALTTPDLLEQSREEREGAAAEYDVFATRAIAPRYKPSDRKVSDNATKMIIAFEVSSPARYQHQPVWPRGQSGVTIGVGYDLGYVTQAWLQEDWGDVLPPTDLALLEKACKVTGTAASHLIPTVTTVQIGWDDAYEQFTTTSLPRFIAETLGVLPNASQLTDDCLGALVSLDYNRGPSFKLIGDRYREMRAIHLHMVNEEFDQIPAELRSMARLWENNPDARGLVIRRKLEAALFEQGLK